jgi:putrescine transport system ATP-binding protein
MTFIIVTHDQEEAMTMASRIGVMNAGKLAQVASPRELYEAPRSRWIAEFVGDVNLFDGETKLRDGHRLVIGTRDAGPLVVAEPREPVGAGRLAVAIRPEKVKLSRRGPVSEAGYATAINRLDGVIADICYLGGTTTYKVKLDTGGTVQASVANSARLDVDAYSVDQQIVAWFSPDDCVVLQS